jgi:hypothetical protein
MSKFKIVKKFSLDFVAPEWKDAYINFNALTVSDVKTAFPVLVQAKELQEENATAGLDSILSLIKSKFIEGKAVNEKGELVSLVVNDIDDLPVSILSKALAFLSQDANPPSPTQ